MSSTFFDGPYRRSALPLPTYPYTIPARNVLLDEDVRPHCNIKQVNGLLLGTNLSAFKDCNGSMDTYNYLLTQYIQEASDLAVRILRTPYDWCSIIRFLDGSGTEKLVLPERNIRDVTQCLIRVLPSQVWYRFGRARRVDGTEFFNIGSQEPLPNPPETFPVDVVTDAEAVASGPIFPTGVEDADLLIDTRTSTLIIPPRVLYAGLSIALWNYTWIPGDRNIEVHYTFGFPPTAYQDGTPLQFTPGTGMVIDPSPATSGGKGNSPIDWSSGIPAGLSMNVAKLVASRVRSQKWFGMTNGLASISVDGASESYGSEPYGGALKGEDEAALKALERYGRTMVL